MAYTIIQPPFSLKFREMPRKELEAYRDWFHQSIPGRLSELAEVVKASPGLQGWEPNLSVESLDALGPWFETQVQIRQRTKDEISEIESRLRFPIEVPGVDLTNRTFSLAFDLGMYFSQVILKNIEGAEWDQPLKNKNFADYGQPILRGFGAVPLNPVRVMVTTAYGIARGKKAQLRELYEAWLGLHRRAAESA